jgi:hypothetical protein
MAPGLNPQTDARLDEITHREMGDEIQIPRGKDPIPPSHPGLDGCTAHEHGMGLQALEGVQQGLRD